MRSSTTCTENSLIKPWLSASTFSVAVPALQPRTYPDAHAHGQVCSRPSNLVEEHVGRDLHEDVSYEENGHASLGVSSS